MMTKVLDWRIGHNRNRRIGGCTLKHHIKTYLDNVIADDPEADEDEPELELTLSALEERLERLERLRMVFAITKNDHVHVVYRASDKGDQIYTLQNRPLPVVSSQSLLFHFLACLESSLSLAMPFWCAQTLQTVLQAPETY